MAEHNTSYRLDLKGNLDRQAREYSRALQRFSRKGRRSFGRLESAAASVGRGMQALGGRYSQMLVGAGGAYAAFQNQAASARIDKSLERTRQTAGMTVGQMRYLRKYLHELSIETAQPFEKLLAGYDTLIAAGMDMQEALPTISAVGKAMAVTGVNAKTLGGSLTVAATAFDFDLSKPEKAAEMIDKMTVAGRAGNAEMEDLAGIFGRVGVRAHAAGLSFAQTLALIEQLSLGLGPGQADRLTTLADSTLRLFTNQKYLQAAAKASGVKFFDAKGERRAAFDVLRDISAQYKQLTTDAQRASFMQTAFGKADMDTQRGLRMLLSGDALGNINKLTQQIGKASGTIGKDLQSSLDNAIDQVERLKAVLGEAGDAFAQPINDAIANVIQYLIDDTDITGKQMLIGGAVAGVGTLAALKLGGSLASRFGGVAGGVATGMALEQATGDSVQPVYVVNMPGSGFGKSKRNGGIAQEVTEQSSKGRLRRWALPAAAAAGKGGLLLGGAAGVSYGAYALAEKIEDPRAEAFYRGMSPLYSIAGMFSDWFGGDDKAQSAANKMERAADKIEQGANRIENAEITVNVEVDQDGRASVQGVTSHLRDPYTGQHLLDPYTGPMTAGGD